MTTSNALRLQPGWAVTEINAIPLTLVGIPSAVISVGVSFDNVFVLSVSDIEETSDPRTNAHSAPRRTSPDPAANASCTANSISSSSEVVKSPATMLYDAELPVIHMQSVCVQSGTTEMESPIVRHSYAVAGVVPSQTIAIVIHKARAVMGPPKGQRGTPETLARRSVERRSRRRRPTTIPRRYHGNMSTPPNQKRFRQRVRPYLPGCDRGH